MIGSQRKTHAYSTSSRLERQRRIRELNDQLRCFARSGVIYITAGVQALGEEGVQAALVGVRDFTAFDRDNDPYAEHDMGGFKVGRDRLLFKIDYYDRERRFGSPDPADPAVTTRVLTIMLASEY